MSYHMENHLLLRLPENEAEKLHEILMAGNLKNRLSLQQTSDIRHGVVKLDGELLSYKIHDLPTIVNSLKTVDNKNFYKTADISQMMVCSKDVDSSESDGILSATKPKAQDKKFQWPHGLTPPLKNVRKRRFRKTARKKYIDSPDIEKEVKRLLKTDLEAVDIHYEIVDDEKVKKERSEQKRIDKDELHKIFEEVSSSESETNEEINVEYLEDSNTDAYSQDAVSIPSNVQVVKDQTERDQLQASLESVNAEISELLKRRERKENLLKGTLSNEMLKIKFQGELEDLYVRLNVARRDQAMLKAKLGIR